MDLVAAHPHNFSDWPFSDPDNAAAFTTVQVLHHGFPVLLASHDADGDWQFLCGTTTELDDCQIVCLGCALLRDPTLAELADLPLGWAAERDDASSPWRRFESPTDEA
jgi:hypothetical protein